MIRTLTRIVAMAVIAAAVSSCASSNSATVQSPGAIRLARSATVIKPADSSRDVDLFLKNALSAKGLSTRVAAPSNSSGSDLTVTYVDRWHWDIVMYLRTLDVSVMDRSGKEIATGAYRNSALHGYPDVEATCRKVVDEIFAKAGR